jgi:hypothetical protein
MKRMPAAAVAAFLLASCATHAPSLQERGNGLHAAGASLIVEMGTHLIVFDPPADEHSGSFMQVMSERFPRKSLRYLVFTQARIEHPERLRAYLAQGREWIVRLGAGAGLRQALASPHTRIVEIAERFVLADEEREVEILPADGPGGLLGYVRDVKSGRVTELRGP